MLSFSFATFREIRYRLVVESNDFADIHCRIGGRRSFTELPVRIHQIIEVDAAERLALPRYSLRVIHGDGDKLIDVDVLHIEHFEHVRTAVAQQTHDFGLISRGIELCFYIRPGGNLAQRQSDSKDLDQNRTHRRTAAVVALREKLK